ncbi:hypothetical protein BDZ45DRAFT_677714 [Acephala macrosclerotiorum]|nr:hypothetical protein BDZ45DRAFT_677714 [Acephala macrosclerotiorum]
MKPSALAGRLTNCKRVWLLHVQRPDLDFGLDDHLIESSTVQTLGRYYWILCIRGTASRPWTSNLGS